MSVVAAGAPVSIGLVFPMEGQARWVSEASLEGVELALAIAREDGASWADRVRLLRSNASTPQTARAEAARLCDEGARVLTGSAVSAICLAASEVSEPRGAFYWEVAAVAEEVTTRGLRHVFSLNADARDFARAGVSFVAGPLSDAVGRIGRVAVVYEDSPFGRSVGTAVVRVAQDAGVDVAVDASFTAGADEDAALAAILRQIFAARPDAVLATCGARAAAALIRGARPARAIVGIGGGFASPELTAELGPLLDGAFSVNNSRALALRPGGLLPEAAALLARYRAACEARGIRDPQADRDLNFIGTSLLVRELLPAAPTAEADALRAAALALDVPKGGLINGMGARFDDWGHNTRGIVAGMQWQDGELRTVHPAGLATSALRASGARGG